MVETMLVLAGIATLVLAVGVYVGRPLVDGVAALELADRRAVALLTEREAVLTTIRDLDADHAAGRLATADYVRLREESTRRGVAILAALDALAAEAAGDAAALTAALEAEVAARAAPAGELPAGQICPACGHACGRTDRFCGGCAQPLPVAEIPPA